jgi:hypothetical protein
MRKLISVILLLIFSSATTGEYTLINSIAFPQQVSLTTDNLGNAYVVVENQLLKFDPQGNPLANYSENNLGSLRFVDAGNPMKVLLFYPDFAKMIVLDSKLSFQSSLDFRSLKINQPLTVCNSSENGYWVYDREDDQLKKIDLNLQVIHESGSIAQAIGYQIQPGIMLESNGFIYLNNPETGILVFDRFGAYYKTLLYQHVKSFQVIEKDILFINKSKFIRYDSKSLEEKEVLIPEKNSLRDARIEQHQLYLLTNDSLKFYSF